MSTSSELCVLGFLIVLSGNYLVLGLLVILLSLLGQCRSLRSVHQTLAFAIYVQSIQQRIVKMFAFHSFPFPAISTPAFSTPALWCRVLHSRVFHSREFSFPFVVFAITNVKTHKAIQNVEIEMWLGVTQGHRQHNHSTERIQLPVRI